MCKIMEELREEAMERGLKRGIEYGLEQGRESNLIENIKNLMDTLTLSVQQAMDALKVPAADQPKYAEMLKTL